MPIKSPAYRNHLRNLQNEADAQKYQRLKKLDLYDEKTFYRSFTKDLLNSNKEVIIYSPFVSKYRSEYFTTTLIALRRRNIAVFIFTRPLEEVDYLMRSEVKCALKVYEELGACIIYLPGLIHQKAAIIDREILWEGSLNILSQRESREMMRRTADEEIAMQVMSHLGLNKKLAEGYKYQHERLYRSLVENSKFNFGQKLKVLTSGFSKLIVTSVVWSIKTSLGLVIFSLKSVKLLMSMVRAIL
jgi:phosphatidylserine/phosphatidylglycerophosphate/cardiolipin synthase-like enzyme